MFLFACAHARCALSTILLLATAPAHAEGPARWVSAPQADAHLQPPGTFVFAATLDSTGTLYAGTELGLFRFNGLDWESVALGHPNWPARRTSDRHAARAAIQAAASDTVRWLCANRDGVLAAAGGWLYSISPDIPPRPALEAALPVILTGLREEGGRLWLGTRDGLFLLPRGASRAIRVEAPQGSVSALAILRDRTLVAGTMGHGLWFGRPDGASQPAWTWEHVECTSPGTDFGLPGNYVHDLHVDAQGTLWAATSIGGLCRGGFKACAFAREKGITDDLHPHDGYGAAIVRLAGGNWSVRHLVQDYEPDHRDRPSLSLLARTDLESDGRYELWFTVRTGRVFGPRGLVCFDEQSGRQRFLLRCAGSPERVFVFERGERSLAVVSIHNPMQGAVYGDGTDTRGELWVVDADGTILSRASPHPNGLPRLLAPVASPHAKRTDIYAVFEMSAVAEADSTASSGANDHRAEQATPAEPGTVPGIWRLDPATLRWVRLPLEIARGEAFIGQTLDVGNAVVALKFAPQYTEVEAVDLLTGRTCGRLTTPWPPTAAFVALVAGPVVGSWTSRWCETWGTRQWDWDSVGPVREIPFAPPQSSAPMHLWRLLPNCLPQLLCSAPDGAIEVWGAPGTRAKLEGPPPDVRIPLPSPPWDEVTGSRATSWARLARMRRDSCAYDSKSGRFDTERARLFLAPDGSAGVAMLCDGQQALLVIDARTKAVHPFDPWPARPEPRVLRWTPYERATESNSTLPILQDEAGHIPIAVRCSPDGRAVGPTYEIESSFTDFGVATVLQVDPDRSLLGSEREWLQFDASQLDHASARAATLVAGRAGGSAAAAPAVELVWGASGVHRLWSPPQRWNLGDADVHDIAQLGDSLVFVTRDSLYLAAVEAGDRPQRAFPLRRYANWRWHLARSGNAIWILGGAEKHLEGTALRLPRGGAELEWRVDEFNLGGSVPLIGDVLSVEDGELFASSGGLLRRDKDGRVSLLHGRVHLVALARSSANTLLALDVAGSVWRVAVTGEAATFKQVQRAPRDIATWVSTADGLIYATAEGRMGVWPAPPAWSLPPATAPKSTRLAAGADGEVWALRGDELFRVDVRKGYVAATAVPGLPAGELLAAFDARKPGGSGGGDLWLSIAGQGLVRVTIPPAGGRTYAHLAPGPGGPTVVAGYFDPLVPGGRGMAVRRGTGPIESFADSLSYRPQWDRGRNRMEVVAFDAYGRATKQWEPVSVPMVEASAAATTGVAALCLLLGLTLGLWAHGGAARTNSNVVVWIVVAVAIGAGVELATRLLLYFRVPWETPRWLLPFGGLGVLMAVVGSVVGHLLAWARTARALMPAVTALEAASSSGLAHSPNGLAIAGLTNGQARLITDEPPEHAGRQLMERIDIEVHTQAVKLLQPMLAGLSRLVSKPGNIQRFQNLVAGLMALGEDLSTLARRAAIPYEELQLALEMLRALMALLEGGTPNADWVVALADDPGRQLELDRRLRELEAELRDLWWRVARRVTPIVGDALWSAVQALARSHPDIAASFDVDPRLEERALVPVRPYISPADLDTVLSVLARNAVEAIDRRQAREPDYVGRIRFLAKCIDVVVTGVGQRAMVAAAGGSTTSRAMRELDSGETEAGAATPAAIPEALPAGTYVAFSITDNATGVDAALRPGLFVLRGNSSTAGHGRGLYDAQQVATAWSGTLHLGWTGTGVGARFELWVKALEPWRGAVRTFPSSTLDSRL